MSCAGKIVLVTGAQQGIGRAMALEFAAAGADVAVNWLDDEGAAQRVADGVGSPGRPAFLAPGGVRRLAPYRTRVNAIAPGLTDTAQRRYGSSEEEIAGAGRALPLGRIAEPQEIAQAAVFLASDAAGFITGQCMHVNGGGYLG